jgi:DNA-directed RNA polymerase specialized sigma24 family protein
MTRTLTQAQRDRIAGLHPLIRRRAEYTSYRHYQGRAPAEDIFQEANLAICQKALADPTFLEQTDSYVATAGIWAAQDASGRALKYEPPTLLDDDTGLADTIAAPETDLDLSIAVREALDGLDGTARTVATMLMQGYRKAEIARHVGIERQSIPWHVAKVRRALAGVAAA